MGQAALFNATNTGVDLTLTHIQVGSGNRVPATTGEPFAFVSALLSPRQFSPIASGAAVGQNQIRMSAIFAGASAFNIAEVGLWAGQPGGSGSVLVAYWSKATGVLAAKSAGVDFIFSFDMVVNTDFPAARLTILADATQSPMLALMMQHEAKTDPHPQYETAAEVTAKITAHTGAADPHPQYATDADLAAHASAADPHSQYETVAEVNTKIAAHTSAADPHPQYETSAETTAKITAHTSAADPHPQYARLSGAAFTGRVDSKLSRTNANWVQAHFMAYSEPGSAVDFASMAFHVQDANNAPQVGFNLTDGNRLGFYDNNGTSRIFTFPVSGLSNGLLKIINGDVLPATPGTDYAEGMFKNFSGTAIQASTTLAGTSSEQWFEVQTAGVTVTLPLMSSVRSGAAFTFRAMGAFTLKGNGADSIQGAGFAGNTISIQVNELFTVVANGNAWYMVSGGAPRINPIFIGQVTIPQGTQSAPGLVFANDGAPDTGLFHQTDGVFSTTNNTVKTQTWTPTDSTFHTPAYAPTAPVSSFGTQVATTEFARRLQSGQLVKPLSGSIGATLAAEEFGYGVLSFTGTLTADVDIIVPGILHKFNVFNATAGGFRIRIKTSAGAGVHVSNGLRASLWCDSIGVYRTEETANTAPAGTRSSLIANTEFVSNAISVAVPVGTVIEYSSVITPAGYLKANGAAVSRVAYAALFAVIGGTFGAGDGSTTFNLPDRRNRMAIGAEGGLYALGTTGGNKDAVVVEHQHTGGTTTNGSHTHALTTYFDGGIGMSFRVSGDDGSYNSALMTNVPGVEPSGDHSHSFTTSWAGQSGVNANLPPYLAMSFYIKF